MREHFLLQNLFCIPATTTQTSWCQVKTKFTLKIINGEDDLNTFKFLINSDNPIPNSCFCFFHNIWTNQTNNAHWQRLRKHKINHVRKAFLQPFLYSGALPKLFPNNYSSIQTQLLASPPSQKYSWWCPVCRCYTRSGSHFTPKMRWTESAVVFQARDKLLISKHALYLQHRKLQFVSIKLWYKVRSKFCIPQKHAIHGSFSLLQPKVWGLPIHSCSIRNAYSTLH